MIPLDNQAISDLYDILNKKISTYSYDYDWKVKELKKTLSDYENQYGKEQTTKIVNHDPILVFKAIYSDIINGDYKLTYLLYKHNVDFKVRTKKSNIYIEYPLTSNIKDYEALVSPIVFLTDVITSLPYGRIKEYYGTGSIKLFYVILKNNRIDENGIDSGLDTSITNRIIKWKIYNKSVVSEYVSVVNKLVEYLYIKGAKFRDTRLDNAIIAYLQQYADQDILMLGLTSNIELLKIILKYSNNYKSDRMFIEISKSHLNIKGQYIKSEKEINEIIEFLRTYDNHFKDKSMINELIKKIFSSFYYDIKTKMMIRDRYKNSELYIGNSLTNILNTIEN